MSMPRISKEVRATVEDLGPEQGAIYLSLHLGLRELKQMSRDRRFQRWMETEAPEDVQLEFIHHFDNLMAALEHLNAIADRVLGPEPPPPVTWIRQHLATKYGISVEAAEEQLASQDYACAICATAFESPRRIRFDHNHDTGHFRGFLCSKCNTGIGLLGDSPAVLEAALDYLYDRGHYGHAEEDV